MVNTLEVIFINYALSEYFKNMNYYIVRLKAVILMKDASRDIADPTILNNGQQKGSKISESEHKKIKPYMLLLLQHIEQQQKEAKKLEEQAKSIDNDTGDSEKSTNLPANKPDGDNKKGLNDQGE